MINYRVLFLQVLSETSSSRPGGYRLFSSSRPPTEMKQSGLGMVSPAFLPYCWKSCLSVLQSFIVGNFCHGVWNHPVSGISSGGGREDEVGEAIVRCELGSQMIVPSQEGVYLLVFYTNHISLAKGHFSGFPSHSLSVPPV